MPNQQHSAQPYSYRDKPTRGEAAGLVLAVKPVHTAVRIDYGGDDRFIRAAAYGVNNLGLGSVEHLPSSLVSAPAVVNVLRTPKELLIQQAYLFY